jgi:hypothetical protein
MPDSQCEDECTSVSVHRVFRVVLCIIKVLLKSCHIGNLKGSTGNSVQYVDGSQLCEAHRVPQPHEVARSIACQVVPEPLHSLSQSGSRIPQKREPGRAFIVQYPVKFPRDKSFGQRYGMPTMPSNEICDQFSFVLIGSPRVVLLSIV